MSVVDPVAPDMLLESTSPSRLDISGPLEVQVRDYSPWHQSRVQTAAWKEDCKKACGDDKRAVYLNQFRCDQDHQFLIDEGVCASTLLSFLLLELLSFKLLLLPPAYTVVLQWLILNV